MNRIFVISKWAKSPESILVTGGDSVPDSGWGVFSRTGGFASPDITELRSVHLEEEVAKEEERRLEETEGYVHYEVSGDPDSNVLNSLSFFTGEVALKGAKIATVVELTYELVE